MANVKLIITKLLQAMRGDMHARFLLAERAAKLICPDYRFTEYGKLIWNDKTFLANYRKRVGSKHFHSYDRVYLLNEIARTVAGLEGDTAECGAYTGASSWFICDNVQGRGKQHHIFDSFEGLSAPSLRDGQYWTAGDLSAPESTIRTNLSEFDFARYYKGWIPSRFHEVSDRKFCLVHVDVDLYQPTLDSIAFFYPRLVHHGVLICDDYGFCTCPGAHQALDEFFAGRPDHLIHMPTGQGMIIKGWSSS